MPCVVRVESEREVEGGMGISLGLYPVDQWFCTGADSSLQTLEHLAISGDIMTVMTGRMLLAPFGLRLGILLTSYSVQDSPTGNNFSKPKCQ